MGKLTQWGYWAGDTTFNTPSICTGPKALHLALLDNGWADYTASTTNSPGLDYDNPGVYSTTFGGLSKYRTYYKNDSLHATLPIYLYLGYWWRYNSGQGYYGASMEVLVGSQINAAGVPLNSTASTHRGDINGNHAAVGPMPTFVTSGPSYSGFSVPQMYSRGGSYPNWNFGRHFMVSRTVDSAGNPTAEGFFVHTNNPTTSPGCYSYFHRADPTEPFYIGDSGYLRRMTLNLGLRATSPVGAVNAYRIQAVTPTKTFVDENAIIVPLDQEWPNVFKATPNLTERTYIPVEDAAHATYNHSRIDSTRLAFRWE